MASGLPVLSYKTKGANEIVYNNKNGVFANNLNDFADIILEIQKSPKKYSKLQKFAFNSVKKYDLKKNVIKIQNMYKNFIN